MEIRDSFDVVVVGSGPAGQKAAIQAAKAGRRAAIIEQEAGVGGACVHRGTIPSKTLRESAAYLIGLQRRVRDVIEIEIPPDLQLASLMWRMEAVVDEHARFMGEQLTRNGIQQIHGRGRLVDERTVEVESLRGERARYSAEILVIATGSRPRTCGLRPSPSCRPSGPAAAPDWRPRPRRLRSKTCTARP